MLSGEGMRGPIVSAFGGNIGALWGRDGGSGGLEIGRGVSVLFPSAFDVAAGWPG